MVCLFHLNDPNITYGIQALGDAPTAQIPFIGAVTLGASLERQPESVGIQRQHCGQDVQLVDTESTNPAASQATMKDGGKSSAGRC